MGPIFDNNGRTALHYCTAKFNEFCQQNKHHSASEQNTEATEELKKKYRSIVRMIEYCLESAECDPDVATKALDQLQATNAKEKTNDVEDGNTSDEEEEVEENDDQDMEEDEHDARVKQTARHFGTTLNGQVDSTVNEFSIFSLLNTVPFIDLNEKHPLEILLGKTQNPNVLHHQTHRTPLLEAIHLRQAHTARMLVNHPLCNINLATSNLPNERQQTPLSFACKSQLLPVVQALLEHRTCNLTSVDHFGNQALHYYLQTATRSNEYVDILKLFVGKLQVNSVDALNTPGKHQRTPLHIAVYHNSGTIDAVIDIEKILIEHGGDLLAKDSLGNLPLHNVFLNKKVGDDPVELCVLISKSMKYQSLDTKNTRGDTPLHLAVVSTIFSCVEFC